MNRTSNPRSLALPMIGVAAFAMASLLVARPAQADAAKNGCESLFEKAMTANRDILAVARKVFCTAQQAYTTIPATDCKQTSDTVEKFKQEVTQYMKTKYPKGLQMGPIWIQGKQSGKVLGITQRKYFIPYMVENGATVVVRRLDGKARARVTVCESQDGKYRKLAERSFTGKSPGEIYRQSFHNIRDKAFSVMISGEDIPIQSLKYDLTVAPIK